MRLQLEVIRSARQKMRICRLSLLHPLPFQGKAKMAAGLPNNWLFVKHVNEMKSSSVDKKWIRQSERSKVEVNRQRGLKTSF